MMDETLNTKQVAAYLNIQPATVRKWRLRYGLPSYRIGSGRRGGTVIFKRKEIDRWLEEYKHTESRFLV